MVRYTELSNDHEIKITIKNQRNSVLLSISKTEHSQKRIRKAVLNRKINFSG